ncbi:MAG: serine/threonine protein kinase, partial [Planctomycetes bacterium]|nr:serine/threonine protein kinase [Planctomycetota bacterium]
KTLAAFDHPHIVPIHDYGQEHDVYYIVMGLVSGPDGKAVSLNDLIRSHGGQLPLPTALRIMEQACSALEYAHQKNVVHRDIKPGNLLIDSQGNLRLVDFGIASSIDRPGDHTLTGSGAMLGSLRYISPEQRDDPASVDGRSDLFSLGKVFYKMLTGRVPEGNHMKACL